MYLLHTYIHTVVKLPPGDTRTPGHTRRYTPGGTHQEVHTRRYTPWAVGAIYVFYQIVSLKFKDF